MSKQQNVNSVGQASSPYDDVLKTRSRTKRSAELKKNILMFLMMLPGFIYLVCNNYLPMFGILIAFKD